MSCYRPLDGYRAPGGSVKIGWEPPGSTEKLRIPCGNCFGCRMDYAEQWSIRCQHEASCWVSNSFVTLTYDDQNLAWHRSLVCEDLQQFLKRLRKRFAGELESEYEGKRAKRIRYFAAGEYGSRTLRPHFHVLLFNLRFPDWSPASGKTFAHSLSELWPFGMHSIAGFTAGRARYVAGYAAKKVRGRIAREQAYDCVNPESGECVSRRPEFVLRSLRPGLGWFWFQRFKGDLFRGYVTEPGGIRKRLPRYYRELLLRSDDFAMADEERRDAYIRALDPSEDTPERNDAKERVHRSRFAAYGRERSF